MIKNLKKLECILRLVNGEAGEKFRKKIELNEKKINV